jgi:hypothetical protein
MVWGRSENGQTHGQRSTVHRGDSAGPGLKLWRAMRWRGRVALTARTEAKASQRPSRQVFARNAQNRERASTIAGKNLRLAGARRDVR